MILATDVCTLPRETGRCRASIPRWFYDHTAGQCSQFTYGGCEGNQNNYETQQECESMCSRQRKSLNKYSFIPISLSAMINLILIE